MRKASAIRSISTGILVFLISGCAGYVPGEKAYWDARIRQLCEKDGGVRILQKLRVLKVELAFLTGAPAGTLGVPIKELADQRSPAYAEIKRPYFKEANPLVFRDEVMIVRRRDNVIVATWVTYARSGGDFPSPAHPSSFSCPDQERLLADLQPLFTIEEGSAQ